MTTTGVADAGRHSPDPVPQRQLEPSAVPRAFEARALPLYIGCAAVSAIICSQINLRLGITTNTAVIGALVAMGVGRTLFPAFRAVERQVMVETATSAGGFAGANIGLVSFATLLLLGFGDLFWPLLVGLTFGMVADVWLGYRLFGSGAFPAEAPWPDGEAVGRVIEAGDEGGRLARQLGEGIVAALVGRIFSLPVAGVGMAFIGSPVALAMLAAGLLIRGYSGVVHYEFAKSYLPHGLMIGAGLVQVMQTGQLILQSHRLARTRPLTPHEPVAVGRVSSADLIVHLLVFVGGAVLLVLAARFWTGQPGLLRLVTWVLYAGVAALVHTIVVGYCAMLSGWFPSFALAIALTIVANLLGFPAPMLAVLAGYVLSTGPQFADLGYDLKSGWIIRGRGRDTARELAGRRQQMWLQQLGAIVGLLVAAATCGTYWKLGLVPPMSRVMAATISLSLDPRIAAQLVTGGVIGICVQALGSGKRALGIMLATGLLLDNVGYGFALAAGLVLRRWLPRESMAVRAPGLIAGDGIGGFAAAIVKSF